MAAKVAAGLLKLGGHGLRGGAAALVGSMSTSFRDATGWNGRRFMWLVSRGLGMALILITHDPFGQAFTQPAKPRFTTNRVTEFWP